MKRVALLLISVFFLFSGRITERGEAYLVFYDERYEVLLYPEEYSMQLSYSCKVRNDGSDVAETAEFFINPLLKVVKSNREYKTAVYEEEYLGSKVLRRLFSVNLTLRPGEETELSFTLSGHPIELFSKKPSIREGVSEIDLNDLFYDRVETRYENGTTFYSSGQHHEGGELYLFAPEPMCSILFPLYAHRVEEFEGDCNAPQGFSVYNYTLKSNLFISYMGDFIKTSEERNNITVRTYVPREIEWLIPFVQNTAHEALDFYSKAYCEYPYEEYTVIAKDYERGGGGGYGNFTVLSGGAGNFYLLAHEISHAWFGGVISSAASEDTWIYEGGATYSQLMMGKALGRDDFDEELKRVLEAGIKGNATENPYNRGAVVFYALQSMMGDDIFSSFIKELFERYGGKEVTTADFVELANEYGDYPLDELLYAEIVPDAIRLLTSPQVL